MLQVFRTKIARWVAVAAAIVAVYALAGFVIAPRIVRNALLEDIPRAMDVTPSVGAIHINPFLFQVEVDDFALAGKGGEKLLGFGRLFIDFQLSSIWHRAYTFRQIEIASPYVNAVVARDGTMNLLALRPKPQPGAPPPAPAAAKPIPALRLGSFKVTQGSVSYQDESRPSQFAALLAPIDFELKDFVTGVEGGLFTFTGVSKLGERVEWHGHVSVQPVESDGELSIQGLRARTLWEYLEDRLNFVIDSGTIDVQSTYKFALKDAIELQMNLAKASLSDLKVEPRNSDAAWVSVPQLLVTGTNVDLSQRRVQVDSVSVSGMKLQTWLEPNGSLNLMQLAAAPSGAASAPPAAHAPTLGATTTRGAAGAPAPDDAGAPWRVELKAFDLRDASILAEDRSVQPAAKVVLAPLEVQIAGASLDLSKPVEVKLDSRIDGKGSIAVSGEVTPQPASASLKVKLSGVDLTTAQPYIAQRTSMTLRSGRLGGEAQLSYTQAPKPGGKAKAGPALIFAGDIDVEDLRTVDDLRHDDLVKWDRLDIRGLKFQQNPSRLEIAEVLLRKPYARAIIESNATLNVTNALKGPGGAKSGTADAHEAAGAQEPAAREPAAKSSGRRKKGAAASPDAAAPGSEQAQSASAAMPMAIKKVLIKDGLANFTDLSVSPHFSAAIQKLQGSVLGLSSKPGSRATVDLEGAVDAFSPVSVKGQVNLLSAALYTDLALDFRNMELSIFNPYSGKFAGYNITKGKLTTELHYKVDGRKLDAQHHIVIDQLEFGDKTDSKDAVSLPIKLAVALLKDRNGVIDLNLPVTGSLDDPKFRLAPIIWKVFVNILKKAVTAPFALLGSLFGGGPDLQFIDFRPGASTVDASQTDKVKAIVKALQGRPQLKIEVPIASVPELDRPALIDAEFDSRLSEAMAEAPSRKKPAAAGTASPAFDELDPSSKLDVLTRVYQHEMGGAPTYPDTVTAVKQKPEQISAKIDFLSTALHQHLTVSDDRFKALGEQRAQALQQALLTDTQIDPGRVFLVANGKATAKDGSVRAELSLR
ncbi:MAG TPA: DUF748 domain-containing protein [Steroidobacteraceae bacterium]